jgi:hypothetical protein
MTLSGQKLAKPRRVIVNVEWHPGELYPHVGYIFTNMARSAENVVAFYNKRGTCEQWIKEGKGAIKWTWLSLFRRQRGSASRVLRQPGDGDEQDRSQRQADDAEGGEHKDLPAL